MTRKDSKGMDPTQMMDTVIKNSALFWENMARFSKPSQGAEAGAKGGAEGTQKNADGSPSFNPWEPWGPAMEAWKNFQASCSSEAFADHFQVVREEGFKQFEQMAKNGWEPLASMGDGADSPFSWAQSPYGLGATDFLGGKGSLKEIFKMLSGEMHRFVSIPPLGLSRNYQEKIADVMEKGNQFYLTLAEYMFLMFSPLEQSMGMVVATMEGLTDEQRRSLTPETVYETWLKELEQGYFALYGSEEYLGLLKRLVSAMGDFNLARQNFMSDCLKLMGIPSENDLDDLYRDLYSLKKKLSSLENSMDEMTQFVMNAKSAKKETEKPQAPSMSAKPVKKAAKEANPAAKAAKPAKKVAEQPKAAPKAEKPTKKTAEQPKPASKAAKPARKAAEQPKPAPKAAKPAKKAAEQPQAAVKATTPEIKATERPREATKAAKPSVTAKARASAPDQPAKSSDKGGSPVKGSAKPAGKIHSPKG
ncbi:poly(R)-hydroxyalkanoic acid synthase subunit PhaE [Desulfoluna sp.]|uniref:poly(R)-hydroxyalkanoic acid synthase subunit PhaE n=1 Tax=Desulfoluna sp. TaxID=2045199 RepID=UPI002625A601|nr:poly(R)-hydroxyalkanoic acid synthase subunit PhaE [Desulfoluna sp.]